MFKTTLIGVQDVPTAIDGLRLARRLSPGAHLTFVRVHRGYRIISAGVSDARASAERGLAASDLDRLSRLTGVSDTLAVGSTTTGDGLADALRQRDGDLLVLAATQILAPTRENLLGALSVLDVPVAIGSLVPNTDTGAFARVGIVHDRTPEGDRGLAVARAISADQGAALSGFDVSSYGSLTATQAAGRASREIAEFAETVDLVILALRPAQLLRQPVGHGTIEEVIAATARPVMLVPPNALIPPPGSAPPTERWTGQQTGPAGPRLR